MRLPILLAAALIAGVPGLAAKANAQCGCQTGLPPAAILDPPPIDPYASCDWKSNLFGTCAHRELLYQSPRGPWYVLTDGVALQRDAGEDVTFASIGAIPTPLLSTHDLDYEYQGGLRALVGHELGKQYAIEGSYFGLMEWDEARAVRNLGGTLLSPFTDAGVPPVPGIDNNTLAAIRTQSSLDNVEISIRQWLYTTPSMMRASALYGIRYMNINEDFNFSSESALSTNNVGVRTENHLVGFQFGGCMEFYIEPRAWVNFESKATLCNNNGEQHTTGTVGLAATPVDNAASDNRTGFIGDLALTFMFAFTPNTVGRIGYQAMWVEGLALGSENFERDLQSLTLGPAELVHDGKLLYHGPFVGLMTTW